MFISFCHNPHCPNGVPGYRVEAGDGTVQKTVNYLVSKVFYPIIEGGLSLAQILMFQAHNGF